MLVLRLGVLLAGLTPVRRLQCVRSHVTTIRRRDNLPCESRLASGRLGVERRWRRER